jgi:molecular chaperone GrpE
MEDINTQVHDEEIKKKEEDVDKTEEQKHHKVKGSKTKDNEKIKKLEHEIASVKDENLKLKDQYLRKLAEFENFKRRTEKEFLSHLENANENLIVEFLPVLDDFERSLGHIEKTDNLESFSKGIELIYKKFLAILEKQGVKTMETVGKEFNTERHQALMQVDSKEYESGHVVQEHQKGYLLNDKVIRHAQVLVSK